MFLLLKRAFADIFTNRFLNFFTIGTIALSILVVSTFILFFENAGRLVDSWNNEIRIMAYLNKDYNADMLPGLKSRIKEMKQTRKIVFISKQDALDQLKKDMGEKSDFLGSLKNNPLPDALEISIKRSVNRWDEIEAFAQSIKMLSLIEDVEYGKGWLGRFLGLFAVFRITGYTMAGLFCMIALFITANTARLALYSRREEVEIMRLVGATDRFIITPFYLEGLLQGAIGGVVGLLILVVSYGVVSSGLEENIPSYALFNIRFISVRYIMGIVGFSSFLGWLGCYLSLKQFLNY